MNSTSLIRILIVDDHKIVRLGLHSLLEDQHDIKVIGEAINAEGAIQEALRLRPDLVLLDIRLPDRDGFQACRAIKDALPSTKVLMLTSVADDHVVLQAVSAGADGYLLKAIEDADIPQAIRTVAAGGAMLDPLIARKVLNQMHSPTSAQSPAQTSSKSSPFAVPRQLNHLSPQENRVLQLVATGRTNKEIAVEMNLGEKTVRNYLSNVFSKLNITRRAEAAALYARLTSGSPS